MGYKRDLLLCHPILFETVVGPRIINTNITRGWKRADKSRARGIYFSFFKTINFRGQKKPNCNGRNSKSESPNRRVQNNLDFDNFRDSQEMAVDGDGTDGGVDSQPPAAATTEMAIPRLNLFPNNEHISDNYDDLKLELPSCVLRSLEKYLPMDLLTANREEKAIFMSDILRKYISREECSDVILLFLTCDFFLLDPNIVAISVKSKSELILDDCKVSNSEFYVFPL